jgi:GTP pyrophosphokinase
MDSQTITAALLHDILEDAEVTAETIEARYGPEVAQLVDGVTKISLIHAKSKIVQNADTIRKMFFAMVKDIRVILIKLADKLHNMRTLDYLDKKRVRSIAEECLDIYAPLAARLGISWIKDELEDLALKSLHYDIHKQIKSYVADKTRAKHFYSIYQKMKRRGKPLDEIYDLLGIRILCENTGDCYTLLGMIHKLWPPLTGRFKDYVAMPKANRYQSLHTTVMGFDGRLMEIQIRTFDMNQTAEHGIAAHWLYKNTSAVHRPQDLAIINKLRDWDQARLASGAFLEEIKNELLKDSIYTFTPQGDVIELPRGATPIDFAYHIHTEVGNHCVAARADGRIVPLRRALKNTQVVEITTSRSAHPHLSWLRLVKTHRARSKVRQWLNRHDDSLFIDRSIVAKRDDRGPVKKKQKRGDVQLLDRARVGVRIGKERNIMIRLAKCCHPSTGDRIVGYISRGRGIMVHKEVCRSLSYIRDFDERRIDVEWETMSPKETRRFRVTAREAVDVFSEIEGAIKKYQGHLIAGKLEPNSLGTLTGYFTMEIDRSEQFKDVLKSLRTLPTIINIHPARGT